MRPLARALSAGMPFPYRLWSTEWLSGWTDGWIRRGARVRGARAASQHSEHFQPRVTFSLVQTHSWPPCTLSRHVRHVQTQHVCSHAACCAVRSLAGPRHVRAGALQFSVLVRSVVHTRSGHEQSLCANSAAQPLRFLSAVSARDVRGRLIAPEQWRLQYGPDVCAIFLRPRRHSGYTPAATVPLPLQPLQASTPLPPPPPSPLPP